ncbi:MAG: hypothetical protein AAFY16_06710 [Cyanobacteria bacterium J06642_3]
MTKRKSRLGFKHQFSKSIPSVAEQIRQDCDRQEQPLGSQV